jgi:hypothetical protein
MVLLYLFTKAEEQNATPKARVIEEIRYLKLLEGDVRQQQVTETLNTDQNP